MKRDTKAIDTTPERKAWLTKQAELTARRRLLRERANIKQGLAHMRAIIKHVPGEETDKREVAEEVEVWKFDLGRVEEDIADL